MNHSILFYIGLAYALCSGGMTLAGLAVLAILYFIPESKNKETIVRLIELGPDAVGMRSEKWMMSAAPRREPSPASQVISHNAVDS
jgi:hypothetical protein